MPKRSGLLREIDQKCLKRRRMRRRRLNVYSTDPRRPLGDLRAPNRQDSTDAAVMAGPAISRIKKIPFWAPSTCPIDLFGPLANRTTLKRLHGVSCSAFLVSYTARPCRLAALPALVDWIESRVHRQFVQKRLTADRTPTAPLCTLASWKRLQAAQESCSSSSW